MNPHEARSLTELLLSLDEGQSPEYLFFWGHTPKQGQAVGPWVLSQWFPSPFEFDGHRYLSAEHWMMAEKARLFGDDEHLAQILECEHPAEAKKLGRLVRGYSQSVWERERFAIVVEGNLHKFRADPALQEWLLTTEQQVLVEASPRDRIWGVGLGAQKASDLGPRGWRGLNLLGFALMEVRDQLKR